MTLRTQTTNQEKNKARMGMKSVGVGKRKLWHAIWLRDNTKAPRSILTE